uniref:ThiF domain-containing protein n=1 Tax=Syphacia muris TaxID=451379 RepID=A0A0N5AWA0_9BILA
MGSGGIGLDVLTVFTIVIKEIVCNKQFALFTDTDEGRLCGTSILPLLRSLEETREGERETFKGYLHKASSFSVVLDTFDIIIKIFFFIFPLPNIL